MVVKNAGRVGVFGASGSGKSSYVKRQIRGQKRVVVFDPLAEYSPLSKVTAHSLEHVREAMARDWSGFRLAYVPIVGQESRCLSALCKLLLAAQSPYRQGASTRGLTLVVEEMNTSFPVHGGAERAPGFAEVCSRGRHSGIHVFGVSQRIAEVSTRFRGNCTETVIFRQQGSRDLTAATDESGAPKAQIGKLDNLDYLHSSMGKISPGRIKF